MYRRLWSHWLWGIALKKKKKKIGGTFVYPEEADMDQIPHSDIELLLPKSKVSDNTKRSEIVLVFPTVSFEKYNMGWEGT